MYRFTCPKCGKSSWSASEPKYLRKPACPYCGRKYVAGEDHKKTTVTPKVDKLQVDC